MISISPQELGVAPVRRRIVHAGQSLGMTLIRHGQGIETFPATVGHPCVFRLKNIKPLHTIW